MPSSIPAASSHISSSSISASSGLSCSSEAASFFMDLRFSAVLKTLAKASLSITLYRLSCSMPRHSASPSSPRRLHSSAFSKLLRRRIIAGSAKRRTSPPVRNTSRKLFSILDSRYAFTYWSKKARSRKYTNTFSSEQLKRL